MAIREYPSVGTFGGITQLATQTMNGLSTITFSAIPQTYKVLIIQGNGLISTAGNEEIRARWNAVTTGNVYGYVRFRPSSITVESPALTTSALIGLTGATSAQTGGFTYKFDDYTISDQPKTAYGVWVNALDTYFEHFSARSSGSAVEDAITEVTIFNGASNNFTGGTITVFGVN